jgi:hypothetical protein
MTDGCGLATPGPCAWHCKSFLAGASLVQYREGRNGLIIVELSQIQGNQGVRYKQGTHFSKITISTSSPVPTSKAW